MATGGGSAGGSGLGTLWARREVLRVAAAVGLLGSLSGCRTARVLKGTKVGAVESPMGPEYLVRGLTELAAAHHSGWLSGHGGAAILAATYFCHDNRLDERTALAVKANVDAFMTQSPEPAPRVEPGPGREDPVRIVEQLDKHVHELRSGGHDATYAALALRALRDVPECATPAVVDGIVKLLGSHWGAYRPVAETPYQREHPLPAYTATAEIAATTFRAVLCPWDDVRQVGASGVLHWITHADAVATLADLGYEGVARHAYAALERNINRPIGPAGSRAPRREPIDWRGPEYWESGAPKRAMGGSWLAGHSFKLPYSVFRLLRRVEDPVLREAALVRSTELLIPFA